MKKKSILIFLFTLTIAQIPSVQATPMPYNFYQGGFTEGAFISGTFVGDDLNSNTQLSTFNGEISAFTMSFSGNSIISSFTAGLTDLFGLVFDLDSGPIIGNGLVFDVEGIGVNTGFFMYTTGNGPGPFPGGEIADLISGNSDLTTLNAVVTSVPEPTSLALMGLGLAGITFARRKKIT